MASMTVYDTDAFNELWNMDFGGYATDALNECAPILESNLKNAAKSSVKHDGDSEMINSIKSSNPKKARTGAYIVNVGPRGYSSVKVYTAKNGKGVRTKRKYSVSNALKAIWKEYGIPGYRDPQPFITSAVNSCSSQIYELMQKRFEEKLKL